MILCLSFLILCFLQPFLHPVDPNEAPGYLTVVQNPICIDDIEKKFERREYTDLASFEKDLKQICNNCMVYNAEVKKKKRRKWKSC